MLNKYRLNKVPEWFIWTIVAVYAALFTLILVRLFTRKAVPNGPARNGQPKRLSDVGILAVTLIAAGYTLYYLIWRLSTLNPDAMAFSWLLWLGGAYGLLVFVLHAFMTWRLGFPTAPKTKPAF